MIAALVFLVVVALLAGGMWWAYDFGYWRGYDDGFDGCRAEYVGRLYRQ